MQNQKKNYEAQVKAKNKTIPWKRVEPSQRLKKADNGHVFFLISCHKTIYHWGIHYPASVWFNICFPKRLRSSYILPNHTEFQLELTNEHKVHIMKFYYLLS